MATTVTLIGLGNLLMRDEGVGVQAVRAIEERYEMPPGVEIVDGGTSGLDLLPYIEGRDRVLFVDAVNFGKEPGYIEVLENREIPGSVRQERFPAPPGTDGRSGRGPTP